MRRPITCPSSAFEGLRKLPPAHTLLWRDGRSELSRYWKLSYRRGPVASRGEAQELIRERLLEQCDAVDVIDPDALMQVQPGAYDLCIAIGWLDTVNDLPTALLTLRYTR